MLAVLATACFTDRSFGDLISEFEPNPAGGDPADTTIELSGIPLDSFVVNILSIENDGFSGTVDRLTTGITGTYDALGLAVVSVPDFENPSFTVLLTEGTVGVSLDDDLDLADDGNLDISNVGTILDSVGVSDATADDATLYSTILGGSSILFNGEFEPLGVFRDTSTGDFFQFVTVDFGGPTERIGVFAAEWWARIGPRVVWRRSDNNIVRVS